MKEYLIKSMLFVCVFLHLCSAAQAESLSLEEVHETFYGGDILNVSDDSLLGQYLEKTQASTVIRKFPTAPIGNVNPPYAFGPSKLVVAVSANTIGEFVRLFSTDNFLYDLHYPNAKHFYLGFHGKYGDNARLLADIQFGVKIGSHAPVSVGSLIIPILLDSVEGKRAENFLKLGTDVTAEGNVYARAPWLLRGPNGAYSAHSAWTGCAHWFGNIPLGNKKVDTYFFPSGAGDVDGSHPNQQLLNPYDMSSLPLSSEIKSLIQVVWQVPGYQQLGELLSPGANRRGEFTNPGWMAYTNLGSVGTDRVPVVFLGVADEKAPIPKDFALNIVAE